MNLLLKASLLFVISVSSAAAQDHRDHGKDTPMYPNPPVICEGNCIGYDDIGTPIRENGLNSYVKLERDENNLLVIFVNEVTSQPRNITFFEIGDVSGYIENGQDEKPEYLTVRPPIGWWCDPCSIIVKDGDVATITLFPEIGA